MNKTYPVNTPKLRCCVCKQHADVVACSSIAAFTLSYCNDCIQKGYEPYDLLVSLGFFEDFSESYRENIVKPSLEYYGKTPAEFNSDVLKEMNAYLDYVRSKDKVKETNQDEYHTSEESEWFPSSIDSVQEEF